MSLALPWEVIERVIDHASDSIATLRSFTLTCRELHPRSTMVLLSRVALKDREKVFSLCAALQAKPHLQPFIRSITIPPAEFSPYPLLRLLDNLSGIEFHYSGWSEVGFAFHSSILKCSHQFGKHIRTLSLKDIRFSSFSAFLGIILSFPNIRILSCRKLYFARNDDTPGERTIRRLSERLELKTLIITEVPHAVLPFFREVAKGVLVRLVFETWTYHQVTKQLQESLLSSPASWIHLRSLTLRTNVDAGEISSIVATLIHLRAAKKLQEVTVHLHDIRLHTLVRSLSTSHGLEECLRLENSLVSFRQPSIWFSSRIPINAHGFRHPWAHTLGKCFPVLAERRLLTLKVESSGQPGHDSSINTPIVTSADSRWVATGSEDGTIIVRDPESGRICQEWFAHPGPSGVYSLAFSVNNRYLVSASGCCSGEVEVWDLHHDPSKAKALVDQYGKLDWDTGGRCVCSASKQTLIAAETEGSHWNIWDGFTFQRLRLDNKWEGKLEALSSNGRWIITSDHQRGSNQCLLWSVAGGQVHPKQLRGHASPVRAAAFNPRSTRVVIAYSDSTLRIYDVETGTEVLLILEGMCIEAIAYSPDGNLLLSRSTQFPEIIDHNLDLVKIWDAHSGALLARLYTPDGRAILSTCFSPCGRYVASASQDGEALVWRICDGQCIAKVSAPGRDSSGRVEKVAVTPDGKWLCCAVDDGRVFFRRMCDLVRADNELPA